MGRQGTVIEKAKAEETGKELLKSWDWGHPRRETKGRKISEKGFTDCVRCTRRSSETQIENYSLSLAIGHSLMTAEFTWSVRGGSLIMNERGRTRNSSCGQILPEVRL